MRKQLRAIVMALVAAALLALPYVAAADPTTCTGPGC